MADVFISYAREDKAFVRRLHDALAARKLDAWVDWEGIPPTADFLQEIRAAIEASDTVILVLSPDWAESVVCAQEAAHALAHNKRLVPIVYREIEPERLPAAVAALNWIFFRDADAFDHAFESLNTAISTDLGRTRAMTRLLVRAIEWDARQHEPSFLLRGVDLVQAEQMAIAGQTVPPQPTALQREYVLASRLDSVRRQRRTLAFLATGLVTALVLAALAFWEYRVAEQRRIAEQAARLDAERKTRIATSQRLAAQADTALLRYPQRSLLLAVEAVRIALANREPIPADAEHTLRGALAAVSGRGFGGRGTTVRSFAVSSTSRWLAAGGQDALYLWDIADPAWPAPIAVEATGTIENVTFAGGDRWIVGITTKKQPLAWVLDGGLPTPKRFDVPPAAGVMVAVLGGDGRRLLAIAQDGSLVLWDLTSPTPTANPRSFTPPTRLEPLEVVEALTRTTADGRWLAYKLLGRPVQLWDLRAQNPTAHPLTLQDSDSLVPALAFSPDQRWLLEAGSDHAIRLWDLSTADPSSQRPRVLRGHDDEITAVAFSRDGRWLATGSMDETARVWDLGSGREEGTSVVLRGHGSMVSGLGISDDGRWVVSSSLVNQLDPNSRFDTTAWLWDLHVAGAPKSFALGGHERGVTAAAMTGDGRWAITASAGGQIRLWNVTQADPAAGPLVMRGHDGGIYRIAVSADGRWLIAHGLDLGIRVWDLRAPDTSASPIVLTRGGRGSLHVSPDSRWLAFGGGLGSDGHLWDLRASNPASTDVPVTNVRRGSEFGPDPFVFSPDARWVVAAGEYAESRLFDLTAKALADSSRPLDTSGGPVRAVAFSPDNRWLVMVREYTRTQARLWDLRAKTLSPIVLGGHTKPISEAAISSDSRWLATTSDDAGVRLWNLQSPDPSAAPIVLTGHSKRIADCTFSPDGRRLVTTSDEGTVQLWDLSAANPPGAIRLEGFASPTRVAFSPNSRWLVTSASDRPTRIWDLNAPRPDASSRAFPGARIAANRVSFTPDSRWIVSIDEERQPRAWDLQAAVPLERPIVLVDPKYRANAAVISADSRWVAVTGAPDPIALKDPIVRLFDLRAPDPAKTMINLLGHERGVSGLAMTSDASTLITSGVDSTVRLWNLRSVSPADGAIVLTGQQGGIYGLAVTPDNAWVVSWADDVRLWPLRGSDLQVPAMRAAGRNFTLDEWALFFPGQTYRRTFTEFPTAAAARER